MRRYSRRKTAPLAIVVIAALVWLARGPLNETFSPAPSGEWRTVVRVVDGDTLVLDGDERVRLIGVDTPESVDPRRPVERYGKKASAFTRRLAEGKRARLAFDSERQDRYGRTLAYVYLEDGTFLNAEIIRQGYGHAYTRFPFRYTEEFRGYEREAREHRRGLWGTER
jgi:micrococcal nuclease